MHAWPTYEPTDYERQFVRTYDTIVQNAQTGICTPFPGVLKRVYTINLCSLAAGEGTEFNFVRLVDSVQISRRSRVHALLFTGDLSSWHLEIRTASGEAFTSREPATALPPLCSSMVPGSLYDALANIGEPPVPDTHQNQQQGKLDLDPNWELMPNEALLFAGTLAATVDVRLRRVLSVAVHCWEFPGMSGR